MAQTEPQDMSQHDALIAQAMAAAQAGRREEAMSILTHLLDDAPDSAKAHWLLAAEYAQAGDATLAETHFVRVLALDPALYVARFQLGLLQLLGGRVLEAAQTWGGLDLLPRDHSLVHFKSGMLLLARDELEAAEQSLCAGLAGEAADSPIYGDMQRVAQSIAAARAAPASTAAVPAEQTQEVSAYDEEHAQALLSLYQRGTS